MKANTTKALLAVMLGTGLSHCDLFAANDFFANGDLILFFQKPGDDDTIYIGLGSAANLFRGTAAGPTADRAASNIVNVNAVLTAAYGAGWASDPEIYTGAIACRSNSDAGTVVNGDHNRTIYASRTRPVVGTVGTAGSSAWDFTLSGASSTAATNVLALNTSFETKATTQIANLLLADSVVDNQNPFLSVPLGIQDTAFNAFSGGIQQRGSVSSIGTFGPVSNSEFLLDLWRITALPDIDTAAVEVSGVARVGSYEGTIVIGTDGNVSFITQGAASSPYDGWMATYPSITALADKQVTADPDADGASNLEEFGFGGNPANGADSGVGQVLTVDANGDSQKDISITLKVRSGATFSASGNDMVSSAIDGVTYRIEGSTDLANWDSAVSEVTTLGTGSPGTGYVFKTFRLNAGNGLAGKGFLRASVTQ